MSSIDLVSSDLMVLNFKRPPEVSSLSTCGWENVYIREGSWAFFFFYLFEVCWSVWQAETFLRAGRQLNAKACSLIIIKAKITLRIRSVNNGKKKHTRRAQRQLVKVQKTFIQRQLAARWAGMRMSFTLSAAQGAAVIVRERRQGMEEGWGVLKQNSIIAR